MKPSKTLEPLIGAIHIIMVVVWMFPATICYTLAWGLRWCWETAKQGWNANGFWDSRV